MLSKLMAVAALTGTLLGSPDPTSWEIFPGDGVVSAGADHTHDPTVVEIGGRFFSFSTSGEGFTVVRTSKDLKSWQNLGPILKDQPEWLAKRYSHKSIWAPDVVVLGDKVRVYYSASNFGTNLSVIGLAECEKFDPERPLEGWRDLGLVVESKPGSDVVNCIDAEVAISPDGRHWMYYGSYWAGIHVVELDPLGGKLKNPEKPNIVCVARNTGERGNPLEGAAVIQRDGYYYLFVSYGLAAQGVRSSYRIMVGRSKEPTGPFLDAEGKSMVDGGHLNVLKTSPPMMSPGHCDVLRLKDGRTVMPYHFYDARRAWFGDNWGMPMLQIRELLWTRDGWPLPGLPVEMGLQSAPAGTDVVGHWTHQVDFGQPKEVAFRKGGKAWDGETEGEWTAAGSEITVKWPKKDAPGQFWTDQLQLAYGGRYYVGRNGSGAVVRGYREER